MMYLSLQSYGNSIRNFLLNEFTHEYVIKDELKHIETTQITGKRCTRKLIDTLDIDALSRSAHQETPVYSNLKPTVSKCKPQANDSVTVIATSN